MISKSVLALFAHPDDVEFMCASTLCLLHKAGWSVHIATMTPGDVGSEELTREEISSIRRNEAAKSAAILDGTYDCLECGDVFIMYNEPTLLKTIALVRKFRPDIVFAPSPSDYIVDHETTSKLVKTACLACGIKNIETPGCEPFRPIPAVYYADPLEGKDSIGKAIDPDILVDISSVIETKEKMLCCHDSQRSWLLKQHSVDEYMKLMKNMAAANGKKIGCDFAEAFRQHLGHGYPQTNLLKKELGQLVYAANQ